MNIEQKQGDNHLPVLDKKFLVYEAIGAIEFRALVEA